MWLPGSSITTHHRHPISLFRRKQCYRTAFNFLTAVHGRRQSPPVISTARQFRAGAMENQTCERVEPAPECDIISQRRRRSSSSPRRDSRRMQCRADPERCACLPERNVVGELSGDDNACDTSQFRVCLRQQRFSKIGNLARNMARQHAITFN